MADRADVVRRLFHEVWNGRRLDVIEELYSPEFVVDYTPHAPVRQGLSAVREMVERAWATFPDYHEELLAMVVGDDDRVALHLRITGTQDGAWGPLPPSGRRLEFEEMMMLTFDANGRVVHQRGIVDNLTGLRQAGVIPPREAPR